MKKNTLVDGVVTDQINLANRGLAYGDGVFETMRLINSSIPLWPQHMKRLQQGCKVLQLSLNQRLLKQQFDDLIKPHACNQFKLKLMLLRSGRANGYGSSQSEAHIIWQWTAIDESTIQSSLKGMTAQKIEYRVNAETKLAGIKHLNRLDQVLAANELQQGVEEGICLNSDGLVVDGISSNLLAVVESGFVFIEQHNCGVQGVMSNKLIEVFDQQNIAYQKQSFNFEQLCHSDEILAINALRGARNISNITDHWQSQENTQGDFLRRVIHKHIHQAFSSF